MNEIVSLCHQILEWRCLSGSCLLWDNSSKALGGSCWTSGSPSSKSCSHRLLRRHSSEATNRHSRQFLHNLTNSVHIRWTACNPRPSWQSCCARTRLTKSTSSSSWTLRHLPGKRIQECLRRASWRKFQTSQWNTKKKKVKSHYKLLKLNKLTVKSMHLISLTAPKHPRNEMSITTTPVARKRCEWIDRNRNQLIVIPMRMTVALRYKFVPSNCSKYRWSMHVQMPTAMTAIPPTCNNNDNKVLASFPFSNWFGKKGKAWRHARPPL